MMILAKDKTTIQKREVKLCVCWMFTPKQASIPEWHQHRKPPHSHNEVERRTTGVGTPREMMSRNRKHVGFVKRKDTFRMIVPNSRLYRNWLKMLTIHQVGHQAGAKAPAAAVKAPAVARIRQRSWRNI
jgi:hypothetical protein